jgi:hypothetical protein
MANAADVHERAPRPEHLPVERRSIVAELIGSGIGRQACKYALRLARERETRHQGKVS